jgi:hypothetical protein
MKSDVARSKRSPVRSIFRMRTRDVSAAPEIVIREQERLLMRWREIHGGN